jgi:hypothetical protein
VPEKVGEGGPFNQSEDSIANQEATQAERRGLVEPLERNDIFQSNHRRLFPVPGSCLGRQRRRTHHQNSVSTRSGRTITHDGVQAMRGAREGLTNYRGSGSNLLPRQAAGRYLAASGAAVPASGSATEAGLWSLFAEVPQLVRARALEAPLADVQDGVGEVKAELVHAAALLLSTASHRQRRSEPGNGRGNCCLATDDR